MTFTFTSIFPFFNKLKSLNMLHLLQLEWKKLQSYRLFQALIFLYIVLLPLGFLIGKNIDLPEATGGTISFYTFPKVWDALAYAGNWMSFFFLGFLGVLIVTNEFSFKTLRQNLITGMSRQEYFAGKVIFMLAVSLFVAIYYSIVAVSLGLIFTDYIQFDRVFSHAYLVPRFFLMSFAYMNFAFMLGVLMRRMGIALFFYFIYTLLIEMIIRYYFHLELLNDESSARNYYPLNTFEDLAPFPIPNFGPSDEFPNFFISAEEAIGFTIVYSLIFLAISYSIFKKKDL